MGFILYYLILLLGGVVAYIAFTLSKAALLPLGGLRKPRPSLEFIVLGIAVLYLIYFSGAWGAFCVALTQKQINRPEVTWDWIYRVVGGVFCFAVSRQWMKDTLRPGVKDNPPPNLQLAVAYFLHLSTLSPVVAIVAYVGFSIWPSLIRLPYGWLSIFSI